MKPKNRSQLKLGVLVLMLIIGALGPVVKTLDDDENLGITFVEASITCHASVISASSANVVTGITPPVAITQSQSESLGVQTEELNLSVVSPPGDLPRTIGNLPLRV